MSPGPELGFGLGLTRRKGGGVVLPPNKFVDSVSGSDANDGLTALTAKQTIAGLSAILVANDRVGMARGSYWHETLTITNKDDVSITAYGSGSPPRLDGAGPVAETWSQHDAVTYPNTWRISVTQSWNVNQARMMIWEDGVMLKRVASIALVNAEAGTYYSPSDNAFVGVGSNFIYVRTSDTGNPNTNGKLYERTKLLYVLNGSFGAADNQSVKGIECCRQGHNDGALTLGKSSTLDGVLVYDGHKHNALQESGVCKNSAFINAQPEINYLHVFYSQTANALSAVYDNVCFVGQENGGIGTNGLFNHDDSGSAHASLTLTNAVFANVLAAVASTATDVSARGVYVENCDAAFNSFYVPGQATLTHWLINGQAGYNSFDSAGGRLVEQAAVYKTAATFIRTSAAFGDIFLNQSTVRFNPQSTSSVFRRTAGSGTFKMKRCLIIVDSTGYAGGSLVLNADPSYFSEIDENVYFIYGASKSNLRFGVSSTIAQWKALGFDANSLFLDTSDISLAGLIENPAAGDFRLKSGLSFQLLNGVSIYQVGVTERWDFHAKQAVAGAPQKWPTIPKTRAQGRTWVSDPAAWDYAQAA